MTSGSDAHVAVRPLDLARVVFLVGFMGAGKSSVGRALSRRRGWAFHDLDESIAAREGRPIEQIFLTSGEAGFRRAEHLALRELLPSLGSSAAVVALGGGTFAQPENLELITKSQARTVFLHAEVEELLRRCQADGTIRPLLRDATQFRRLYESRRNSYLGASLHIETGGKDVDTVVAEIERRLGFDSSD
jgi:shikimate kinase